MQNIVSCGVRAVHFIEQKCIRFELHLAKLQTIAHDTPCWWCTIGGFLRLEMERLPQRLRKYQSILFAKGVSG